MGTIHAAKRLTPRLDRVLQFLRRRGATGATTREIVVEAQVCAVNSIVAEIKTLGYQIKCKKEAVSRFRYRLIES